MVILNIKTRHPKISGNYPFTTFVFSTLFPFLRRSTVVLRGHKMAARTQSPADKTPHTLVDAASVDQGADGKVDSKEEREFV